MPPPSDRRVLSDHYFRLSVPGLTIGTFQNCNGLSMEFDVFEWAEGGNNEFIHHLPGRVRYPYLQLSAGMTDDNAMQAWFWKTREQAELKEVTIELTTQDGGTTRSWSFTDAFPVRWSGPGISASGNGLATESLDIAHSGLKMG
jgi:phage tail-like protein